MHLVLEHNSLVRVGLKGVAWRPSPLKENLLGEGHLRCSEKEEAAVKHRHAEVVDIVAVAAVVLGGSKVVELRFGIHFHPHFLLDDDHDETMAAGT